MSLQIETSPIFLRMFLVSASAGIISLKEPKTTRIPQDALILGRKPQQKTRWRRMTAAPRNDEETTMATAQTTIRVDGSDAPEQTTDHNVCLIVKHDVLPANNHLEIKVTDEGIILELWDDAAGEFTRSQYWIFEDFFDA